MTFLTAANKARRAKSSAGSARIAASTTYEREMADAIEELANAVVELSRALNNTQ